MVNSLSTELVSHRALGFDEPKTLHPFTDEYPISVVLLKPQMSSTIQALLACHVHKQSVRVASHEPVMC